ncbi:hypothetical protein D3C73_1207420 [compost metagenome]
MNRRAFARSALNPGSPFLPKNNPDALRNIRQSNPFTAGLNPALLQFADEFSRHARPVVTDPQIQAILRAGNGNGDDAGPDVRLQRITDRVLHQRLQCKLGNQRIQQTVRHIQPEIKPFLKARPLDNHIAADDVQLLFQGNERIFQSDGAAEQEAQRLDHF